MTKLSLTGDAAAMRTRSERWWDGPWPWLVYLIFYVMPWIWRTPGLRELLFSALGLAVFLPAYFVSHRLHGARLLAASAVMLGVGVALSPVGGGWTVFPIYAATQGARLRPIGDAIAVIIFCAVVAALTGFALGQPLLWWLPSVLLVVMTGGATISREAFYARTQALLATQEEVRRLAGTAERERMARDLHDVVGRTLTLVALKADLAARLIARDTDAAEAEMRAVGEAARAGLTEVRAALAGQPGGSLSHETTASVAALRIAGVSADLAGDPAMIPDNAGAILAMTLREAVTNVIRHAGATRCTITIERIADAARLVVADDGNGGAFREGNGLTGMRERLTAAGGTLAIAAGAPGTRLVANVPA